MGHSEGVQYYRVRGQSRREKFAGGPSSRREEKSASSLPRSVSKWTLEPGDSYEMDRSASGCLNLQLLQLER